MAHIGSIAGAVSHKIPFSRQPFFFFLPDLVDIGEHFFQFGKLMSLGKMVG
jgi:hypothetical protein